MALSAGNQLIALAMIEMEGRSSAEVAATLHASPAEVEQLHQQFKTESLGRTLRATASASGSTPRPSSLASGRKRSGV